MNDLISRQAAIDVLERKKDKNAKGDIGGFYNKIIQNDIDALIQLPSAQPEIIRCKDCLIHGVCRFEQGLGLDGYCSQAERREE